MNRKIKFVASHIATWLIFSACGLISIFLILSGYESFAAKSLPFLHTVDAVSLSAIAASYNLPANQNLAKESLGSYGKPIGIKFPSRSVQLPITAPILDGNQWLARTNTFHMFITSPPRGGGIGAMALYCRSSFRTIDSRTLPKINSNIFIDTEKDWRYVYRVTSAKFLPASTKYVPADSGAHSHLLILCGDEASSANYIIEALLISVQGIEE